MNNIIKHAHTGIMWLVVVMLVVSIIISLLKLMKKEETVSAYWYKFYTYTKWVLYIQALFGIVLLMISPLVHYGSGFMKNSELRFYGMEHPLMMFIAIGLVSVGLFKSKKKTTDVKKNKYIFIYYTIALAVVLFMIPWTSVMS